MSADTSTQAVEQLASDMERYYIRKSRIIETLRALAAERAAMREVLLRWQHYGCPDCGGDCGSANPPVAMCLMQQTRAALKGGAA